MYILLKTKYLLSEAEYFGRHSRLIFLLCVSLLTPSLPQKGASMSARRPNGQESFERYESNLADGSFSEVKSQTDYKVLPPDLIVGPYTLAEVELARKTGSTKFFSARVMARLQQAEAHEVNLHFKSDYRQAWITLSFLQKGRPDAFVQASQAVHGVHPDKVFPRWLEEQKVKLGKEFYLFYNDEGVLRLDVPRIPPKPADADTPANGADSLTTGKVGPVPTSHRRTV